MKMKTLAVNGDQFRVNDDGAVRYDEAQKLTDEQKEQARKNINAAGKIEGGIIVDGKDGYASIEVLNKKDENGYKHTSLYFLGYEDGTVKLCRITDGEQNWDAATVGQVNAALEEKQEQISALAAHATYKNLYGRVEITAEDIAAAGDEGITVITIGSEDVDLSKYNDILFRIHVPDSSALNSANGAMVITATPDNKAVLSGDRYLLLKKGSSSISTVSYYLYNRKNYHIVKTQWADDTFLYGEVIRNGYGDSYGYTGAQNGWAIIYDGFAKSKTHYFHISANISANGDFKFPAGTYVEVYGR